MGGVFLLARFRLRINIFLACLGSLKGLVGFFWRIFLEGSRANASWIESADLLECMHLLGVRFVSDAFYRKERYHGAEHPRKEVTERQGEISRRAMDQRENP